MEFPRQRRSATSDEALGSDGPRDGDRHAATRALLVARDVQTAPDSATAGAASRDRQGTSPPRSGHAIVCAPAFDSGW